MMERLGIAVMMPLESSDQVMAVHTFTLQFYTIIQLLSG